MNNFLQDRAFLNKVNKHKVRKYNAAILVLDYETENPIARLEGQIISGTININANSSTRRTCSLTMTLRETTARLTDINNLISPNKKISLAIGFDNPFFHNSQYREYGEQLWFKQGVFVISKGSVSMSTAEQTLSIELIDKMALLNGVCGGTLPASVSFHEKIIYDSEGNYSTEYPLIKDIITECVHHFGGEHFSRIYIEDVPEVGRRVVKYGGSTPINFQSDQSAINCGRSFVIGDPPIQGFEDTYYKDDIVGYMEVPLTYPGELIMKPGSTVTNVLDEIVKTLGNFEYFYDEEGIFHFRKIAGFMATGNTPLNYDRNIAVEVVNQQGQTTLENKDADATLQSSYFPRFSDDIFINEFADNSLITQMGFNPKYDNLKNDFICWGTRSESKDVKIAVRYHLAIDSRPFDVPKPALGSEMERIIGENYSLCHKNIREVINKETKEVIRYSVENTILHDTENEEWGELVAPALEEVFVNLSPVYWFNWREELYRRALLAYGTSTEGSYYDQELLAEWRNLYDPTSTFDLKGAESFQKKWEDHFGEGNAAVPWSGYDVRVKIAPSEIKYWLDIIDTSAPIGQYGVNRIGRRSKVVENTKINQVFEISPPDIVFIENDGNVPDMLNSTAYYVQIGQPYSFINSDQMHYFTEVNSFGTCYEVVREMLYNHLIYNAAISLSAIPVLYLDVNKIVHINNPTLGITGDYIIASMSITLGQQSSMNLSLNEAAVMI